MPAGQHPPAVAVEDLQKRFGTRVALDGLTFSVPEGEVFGLVGSNGAGKTTALRILATLVSADGGRATVAGIAVGDDPEAARASIGYLPDSFGTYDRLTASEHIEFYAGIRGVARPRRRPLAAALLELVGLAERGDDDVTALSRGHRQRLGLAQALVHDPPVLLLDDPASGLDPRGQLEMRELVKDLAEAGKTIVVASNDMAAVEDMCTSVGVMDGGAMVASGSVAVVRGEAPEGRLAQAVLDVITRTGA